MACEQLMVFSSVIKHVLNVIIIEKSIKQFAKSVLIYNYCYLIPNHIVLPLMSVRDTGILNNKDVLKIANKANTKILKIKHVRLIHVQVTLFQSQMINSVQKNVPKVTIRIIHRKHVINVIRNVKHVLEYQMINALHATKE